MRFKFESATMCHLLCRVISRVAPHHTILKHSFKSFSVTCDTYILKKVNKYVVLPYRRGVELLASHLNLIEFAENVSRVAHVALWFWI